MARAPAIGAATRQRDFPVRSCATLVHFPPRYRCTAMLADEP
jgi:hypothetical protein